MEASFESLKFNDRDPVYIQIIRYLKIQIHLGRLKNGDGVPSRRVLAATLAVNPATVQKVYKMMEDEGLLITALNTKSEIFLDEVKLAEIRKELTEKEVRDFLVNVKNINLTFKELIDLISELWDDI